MALAAVAAGAWLGIRFGDVGAPADGLVLKPTVATTGTTDTRAVQRNLRFSAAQPDPVAIAIRQVVAPGTPDETVRQLVLTLNLICAGRIPPPQALHSLQDLGLDAATARRILDATHTPLACDPTARTAP